MNRLQERIVREKDPDVIRGYMLAAGIVDKLLYLWRRWRYLGELDGLDYVIFQCPYCKQIAVGYNHGRPDKLRVTCNHCNEQVRFGYWKHPNP